MTQARFPELLTQLRAGANLTIRELGEIADVPHTFIASVQTGQRRIGELQATKLGTALGLSGRQLREFVLKGIDTSAEKLLKEIQDYPSALLNWLPVCLKDQGIMPDQITGISGNDSDNLKIRMGDGSMAVVQITRQPS